MYTYMGMYACVHICMYVAHPVLLLRLLHSIHKYMCTYTWVCVCACVHIWVYVAHPVVLLLLLLLLVVALD